MLQHQFLKHIQSPSTLNRVAITELENLVQQFPYFQSAHLLLSIAAKQHDSALFQKHFRYTAIVMPNRKQLHYLLHPATEKDNRKHGVEENKVELMAETALDVVTKPEALHSSPLVQATHTNTNEKRLQQLEERLAEIEHETLLKSQVIPVTEPSLQVLTAAIPENLTEHQTVETENKSASETLKQQLDTIQQSAEFIVENEIEKSLVNAFVEKEILKTHTANQKEEPFEEGSFNQWLHFFSTIKQTPLSTTTKLNPRTKSETSLSTDAVRNDRVKKMALIDKIIEKNPSHIRLDTSKTKVFTAEKTAKDSLLESEHLVTETLAKIYAMQGNLNKAIRAYEILSLKYPNKSVYFASLIKELKK